MHWLSPNVSLSSLYSPLPPLHPYIPPCLPPLCPGQARRTAAPDLICLFRSWGKVPHYYGEGVGRRQPHATPTQVQCLGINLCLASGWSLLLQHFRNIRYTTLIQTTHNRFRCMILFTQSNKLQPGHITFIERHFVQPKLVSE